MGAQAVRLSNVDINNALENKDFEVLFQPIFDLSNGGLARMETFVRWRHPSLGVLPPGAFISFFESQGRMGELTRYVLDTALANYSAWRGASAPGFSINLSLADLADDAFTSHLTTLLQTHDFPPELVTLECPMPAVDSDLEGMIDRFANLRKTGARLAIEVRGRANDLLRTIDPFPFDEIKTGGSSILRFARTVRGPGLSAISDLLDIAKKANAVTTAVGVEDQASLSALRGLGFTAAQGAHLGQVGSLDDFRPSHVNYVRELLDLPPLNSEDLAALFRTSAPDMLTTAAPEATPAKSADKPESATAEPDVESKPATPSETSDEEDKKAVLARARKKAKAIALAKRARARDARKAAAIKRAKAKVALAKQNPDGAETPGDDTPPRVMQDRIEQEFAETPPSLVAEPVEPSAENVGVSTPDEDAKEVVDAVDVDFVVTTSNADNSAPKRSPMDIKMPVADAQAHFRPGVSVRWMPTSHDSGNEVEAHPIHNNVTQPPDIAFEEEWKSTAQAEKGDAEAEELVQPFSDPEPDSSIAFARQDEVDQVGDDDQADDARPMRGRKQKSFLKRRYKVVPTHFWPKPWTRALRRRRTARNEAEAAAEA